MHNRVLVYAEAVDVAAEGAVWYARRIGDGEFSALHVPGPNTDTGISARWFDLTGGATRLDVRAAGTDAATAVLESIAELRRSANDVVTVVLPEQFKKRSLMAAAQRAQFRLKLRLLTEPGVVVADVPTVTSDRRPEGKVPVTLQVRVLADRVDDASRRAVEYAKLLGEDDLRVVQFGDEGGAGGLGLPVDVEPQPGRLGDAVLVYVRRLTEDPTAAVNVILPERLHESLPRLRGRRALAVKRCLLFEPHVILSSVPSQAAA